MLIWVILFVEILLSEIEQYCLIFSSLLKYSVNAQSVLFILGIEFLRGNKSDIWKQSTS